MRILPRGQTPQQRADNLTCFFGGRTIGCALGFELSNEVDTVGG